MGYYIQCKVHKGKAAEIVKEHKGELIGRPKFFGDVSEDKGLVCVVDNGLFEAAAFCFSEREFQAFSDPLDYRPKQWLVIEKVVAKKLSGYEGE